MTRKAALIGAAIVLLLVPASALGAKRPPRLTLPLPAPGHVSVAAVSIRVKADRPRGLVRHVRVRALRVKSLPPSVRVLTATRFKRSKHGGTYSAFVLVVNRAEVQASSRPKPPDFNPKEPETLVDLIFGATPTSRCPRCGFFVPDDDFIGDLCSVCRQTERFEKAAAAQNADEPGTNQPMLTQMLKADWSSKGGEAAIDSGHYDDGHAFGWGLKTKPEIRDVERQVVDDMLNDERANILAHLETASGTDLNGNGKVDQPTTGGGQQIDTTVGPPTIL